MKQFIFSFAALLFAGQCATAQYNRYYDIGYTLSTPMNAYTQDVISARNGETCILSVETPGVGSPIQLKKVDISGNVIFSEVFVPQSPTNLGLKPHRLMQTDDNGFMVVGMCLEDYTHSRMPLNPFVAKFDNSGNFQWFKVIQSNIYWFSLSQFEKVDIVRAQDDPYESYILVAPGGNDDHFSNPYHNILNAFKIDASGAVIWNMKYGVTEPNFFPSPHTIACGRKIEVIEHPEGIEEIVTCKYFIAGTALRNGVTRDAFDICIDGNGAVLHPYREYDVPGYPMAQDALYDDATGEFVMAYTFGNVGVAPAPNASTIALSKFDFNTMNINSTDYFWQPDVVENYGTSIIENAARDGYVIGCDLKDDYALHNSNPSYGSHFMNSVGALLEVDKSSNVNFFKRYNKLTGEFSNMYKPVALVTDGGTTTYVMGSATRLTVSGPDRLKVISADVNGEACGADDIPWGQATEQLTPHEIPQEPYIVQPMWLDLDLINPKIATLVTDCDENAPDNSDYFKPASVENITMGDISVYPTLLQQDEHVLNFEMEVASKTNVHIALFDMSGRILDEKKYENLSGKQQLSWDIPLLPTGSYLVKIMSDDISLQKAIRVSKL